MKNFHSIGQLLLRFALGIGFILPVLDRLGYFGEAGEANVAWGDWTAFVAYTHQLMPYLSLKMASFFAFIATCLELVLGILLLVGYKIRYAALGSFALTLIFALSMMFFLHFRAPFNYSVFVASFSSLLLAGCIHFPWSIDSRIHNGSKSKI